MIDLTNEIFRVSADKDLEEEVEKHFKFWRKHGFPNYKKESYDYKKELDKLIKFNENSILINNKDLKQTMHCCGFLWTYFPHWIEVKCGDAKTTLLENWNDDDKLKSLIRKTYKWQLKYGSGVFTINRLRQNAKVYLNKQTVSNFRPTVAKFIYNRYGNNGTVWDMSCGWGGRMLGFLSSNCKKYIGVEPSDKTFVGLNNMKNDYNYIDKEIELYKIGSEDFVPKENSLDLCFTSPPYFNTEKYSEEPTQSYIRYPTSEKWIKEYLTKTIKNCYYGLKNNGYMIINIANVKTCKTLEESTINISKKIGFKHIDTYNLILSSISGKGVKKEPVFIFQK